MAHSLARYIRIVAHVGKNVGLFTAQRLGRLSQDPNSGFWALFPSGESHAQMWKQTSHLAQIWVDSDSRDFDAIRCAKFLPQGLLVPLNSLRASVEVSADLWSRRRGLVRTVGNMKQIPRLLQALPIRERTRLSICRGP